MHLGSRQMGKSSLMVRTALHLREAGARVAILDLTAIGQNLTVEQWYDGLMSKLGQQLDLEDELLDFWRANEAWGPLLRWMTALEKVVLPKVGVQALACPPQPETRDKLKLGLQPRLVIFHFADGQTAEQPIIYGRDVRNFSPLPGDLTPPGSPEPAWTDNSSTTRYQLFKVTWMNPHPEVEIKSMDFISSQTLAAPFLIAVTAEP